MVSSPIPRRAGDSAGLSSDEEDFDEEEFDIHGFVMPPSGDAVGDSTRAYATWFKPKAARRSQRFELFRKRLPDRGSWASLPQKPLKAMLRKGLPSEHRKEVWWSILGCEERRQRATISYREHLEAARRQASSRTNQEIERDLQRTFPNHRSLRTEAGQSELRNVLCSYSQHSPRVQYCQGLNFIAALLLVVMKDEEHAFWALVCAMEVLGLEAYYTEGMTLLRADMKVLAQFLEKKCPKVARTFSATGADLTSISSEWFLTWFSKCLPTPTVLRVWDTLFFEGFKILFRIAVGIFKLVEADIVRCDAFEDVMEQAKSWPRCMVKHNELLKASFKGVPGLRRADLLKARDDALGRIDREDEDKRRRVREARERSEKERAARLAAMPPAMRSGSGGSGASLGAAAGQPAAVGL